LYKEEYLVPQKQSNVEKIRDHEKVFLAHYEWLLARARKLNQVSIHEAEDLVQDIYVRFVQTTATPDLADADRVRGYLYKILDNLFIEKHRRSGTDALQRLLIIDFDSIEYAIATVDRSHLLQVRTDLAKVCEYACIRRRTSRAASALILRFFLGYLPSELVAIFRTSRSTVDGFIRKARQEAKAYLTRPGVLQFMGQNVQQDISTGPNLPEEPSDLFAELRRRIFSDPVGECLSEEQIVASYDPSSNSTFSTLEFAHIVSCRRCLDLVNKTLGFQNLKPRLSSGDILTGRENSIKPSMGDGGPPTAMLRRKIREWYEHRPEKLQLVVDGEIVATQFINGAHSEFQVRLEPLQRPKFIELVSEQWVGLIYLDIENLDRSGLVPEGLEVHLSDDRVLSVELTYGCGAQVVNVSYFDPVIEEVPDVWSDTPLVFAPTLPPEKRVVVPPIAAQRRWRKLLSWLSGIRWQSPIAFAVALGIILIGVVGLIYSGHRAPAVQRIETATELLAESTRHANEALPTGGAVRRTFAYEVRSAGGDLLQSGQVEALRTRDSERIAIRLRNRAGKLIAGRWVNSDGRVATYTQQKGIGHSQSHTHPRVGFDEAWLYIPDAQDFEELVPDANSLTVDHETDDYQLNYGSTVVSDTPRVVSAHLRLNTQSMRPSFETFRIRSRKQVRDYEFRELSYEVVPADRLKESDFDPDPDLVSLHPTITGPLNPAGRDAHFALEALLLLSNLGQDVERVVDLNRQPTGAVELSGVFPTATEKENVARVFRPLQQQSHGLITLSLHSDGEPADRKVVPAAIKIEALPPVSLDTARIPLDAEFRTAFAAQGLTGESLNARIRETATDARHHASQIHRETWTIHDIAASDFTREELRVMEPEDKMLWLTLLDKHIRILSQELAALASDLTPLFQNEETVSTEDESATAIRNTGELGSTAEALNHDGSRLDQQLTAALTLSPSSLPANHNVQDIAHKLAVLKTEERALHGTIEHLQAFGQDHRNQ
jgi:DNA-directed RNA polymerase specialized sigma24 family protein